MSILDRVFAVLAVLLAGLYAMFIVAVACLPIALIVVGLLAGLRYLGWL